MVRSLSVSSQRNKSVAHHEDVYSHNLPPMDEKEMALYKLYRPERVTPKKRSAELLKEPRLNKVSFHFSFPEFLGIRIALIPEIVFFSWTI